MVIKNIPLTKADFDTLPWQGLINEAEQKECDIYYSKFFAKAKEAETAGNDKAQEIYTLLGAICSFHFKPENKDEPFGPKLVLYHYQLFLPLLPWRKTWNNRYHIPSVQPH